MLLILPKKGPRSSIIGAAGILLSAYCFCKVVTRFLPSTFWKICQGLPVRCKQILLMKKQGPHAYFIIGFLYRRC